MGWISHESDDVIHGVSTVYFPHKFSDRQGVLHSGHWLIVGPWVVFVSGSLKWWNLTFLRNEGN